MGPLDLVHVDLRGPVSVRSLGGGLYFLTIVDDFTRYVWVHVLKKKSEVFDLFKQHHTLVERQTGLKLHKLRSDNGGEFCSNDFSLYC